MYDVIVIGGGHAGIEASLVAAKLNKNTLLITGKIEMIGNLPCNPSIGGPAKGIVVREIDALGGEMGKNADRSYLQMKMLNLSKGPAVRALRAQVDKVIYPKNIQKKLLKQNNLAVKEGYIDRLIVENNQVKGVVLEDDSKIVAKAVILCTGTYMQSNILVSDSVTNGGPEGERSSIGLSNNLRELGFKTFRLKTGTPPRIKKDTVDYHTVSLQPGDDIQRSFSFAEIEPMIKVEQQISCYLTYTNLKTHQIIADNLNKSSMYSGQVKGVGPRYCPSIEDKIVRFNDRERHQLFLEPESLYLDTIYLAGFSSSMPHQIQEQMVNSIEGLNNAVIDKYAYAIEYDAIDPTQLHKTLETKLISGLYTAGQVNGTSGYEEAACQGLIASINACLKLDHKEPLILGRNEAYIGVLIDDLVTKGTQEPYRLLTSRAEFRLLLRHDNADSRLLKKGYQIGLIEEKQYFLFLDKEKKIQTEIARLKKIKIYNTKTINEQLVKICSTPLKDCVYAYDLLKRPEINYNQIKKLLNEENYFEKEISDQIEIEIKYKGYIDKAIERSDKMAKLEKLLIPANIDYRDIHNLALEAKEKLTKIRPVNIGQVMRISGITPADVSVLMIYVKGLKNERDV